MNASVSLQKKNELTAHPAHFKPVNLSKVYSKRDYLNFTVRANVDFKAALPRHQRNILDLQETINSNKRIHNPNPGETLPDDGNHLVSSIIYPQGAKKYV